MSVIDEVKSRIDIVDLLSQYVTLQKAGRSYKALCPFHSEKTPSFSISPERQTWYCFGACGTGGDVFNFIMKREGVDFGEALRLLAERAGVSLAERRDPQDDERHQRLLQANEAAASYFHHALGHSKAAEAARAYFGSRGLDAETIEAFQLGFSPESWDTLKSHLTQRGFTQEELLAAGLLVESDRGGYDRFRGRLMFPIRDDRGRVVGFGARALAASQGETSDSPGAKYINTPQTPAFDKSGLLYALDRAKEAIRREKSAIVVEGYMDVIAAHQHGITNVVASMGTALTERQIRTLERFKSRILLAMDADAAGIEATLRALQEAEATGAVRADSTSAHPTLLGDDEFSQKAQEWSRDALKRATVNFYVVPLSGKDPDEMIRADRAGWEAALVDAKPFTDHVFETVAARKDLSQPSQRAELLQELLPVVRLIEEPVYRAHYVQRLARLARLDEKTVRATLQRSRGRPARRGAEPAEPAVVSPVREPQEEFCLALLLRHPELRQEGTALSPELFLLGEHRAIFTAWHEAPDPESVRRALPEELHPHLESILQRTLPYLEGAQLREALRDCVRRIEFRRLSAAKQASTAALADFDSQEEVQAAVREAYALLGDRDRQDQEHTPSAGGDSRQSEKAITLVEDMEVGRRLHQMPPTPPPASPQGEDTA
jgi:DNA primase